MNPDPRDVNPNVITALLLDTAASKVATADSDAPPLYADVLKSTGFAIYDKSTFLREDEETKKMYIIPECTNFCHTLMDKHKAAPAMTRAIGAMARFEWPADAKVDEDALHNIDMSAFLLPFARDSMYEVAQIARERFAIPNLFPVPAVYHTSASKWASIRARGTITGDVSLVAIRAMMRTDVKLLTYDAAKVGARWIELLEGGVANKCGRVVCSKQLESALDEAKKQPKFAKTFIGFELDPGDIIFAHPGMVFKCKAPKKKIPKQKEEDDDEEEEEQQEEVNPKDFFVQTMAFTTKDNGDAWNALKWDRGFGRETSLGAFLGTSVIGISKEPLSSAKPAFPLPADPVQKSHPVEEPSPTPVEVPKPKPTSAFQALLALHESLDVRIAVLVQKDAANKLQIWDPDFEKIANKHRATGSSATASYKPSLETLATKVKYVEDQYEKELAVFARQVKASWEQLQTELGGANAGRMNGNHMRKFNSLVKMYEDNEKGKALVSAYYGALKSFTRVHEFCEGVALLIKTVDDAEIANMPPLPKVPDLLPTETLEGDGLREFLRTIHHSCVRGGVLDLMVGNIKRREWNEAWLAFRNDFVTFGAKCKEDKFTAVNVAPIRAMYAAIQTAASAPKTKTKAKKRSRGSEEDDEEEPSDAVNLMQSDGEDDANDPAMKIDPKDKAVKRDAAGNVVLDENGDPIFLTRGGENFIAGSDEEDEEEDDDEEHEEEEVDVRGKRRLNRLRKRVERSDEEEESPEDENAEHHELAHRVLHCKKRAVNIREWEELADQYCTLTTTESANEDKSKHHEALSGRIAGIELRTHLWSVYKRDKRTGVQTLLVPSYLPTEADALKAISDRKATVLDLGILDDPNEYSVVSQTIEK